MVATQITAHKNYIGGQWVESVTGRTYQVHNPATPTRSSVNSRPPAPKMP